MPPREGAFAERLVDACAQPRCDPRHVPTEKAALAEPLACGWHAVRLGQSCPRQTARGGAVPGHRRGRDRAGRGAGAGGKGAREITLVEANPARREVAAGAGDFRVVEPEAAENNVDLVVDGVGIEATRAAASANARPGGVIVHIGLGSAAGGLDVRRMTLQEITFIGTYTYTAQDFRDTAAAMFDGRLGALDWPEIRPLSEGPRAFAQLQDEGRRKIAAPMRFLRLEILAP